MLSLSIYDPSGGDISFLCAKTSEGTFVGKATFKVRSSDLIKNKNDR